MRAQNVTKQFDVVADDGRRLTIFERTEMVPAPSMDDPNGVIEGLKRLTTSEGMHVNAEADGSYVIVALGLRARRVC